MTDDGFERLGEKIGHIRLTSVVGQGGMGTVYAGFDEKLQRHVAVKAIHGDFRLNQEAKARFLREARILSQLNHPLTCTIHDFVEGDASDFLIMELIKGKNLREVLKEGIPPAEKFAIAEQLLEVLKDVHEKGVIHRDLKPENIMIEPGGRIKVLDFGLSRSVGEPHSSFPTLGFEEARNRPAIDPVSIGESVYVKTKHGAILGTAAYMSPEQARGEAATAASDVYSVGLILQELFTGKRAFEDGLPASELLQRATRAETQTVLGLPKDLKNLVDRMKSAVPGARPSSADALGQLRFIIDKPKKRRRKIVLSALWVLIAMFSAVATLQWIRAEREAERAETQALKAEQEALRAQEEASNSRAVTEFLVDLFKLGNPDQRGSTTTVKEVLAESVPKLELQLGDRPKIQIRLLETIGTVYENLGLYQEALPIYERCVEIAEAHNDQDIENSQFRFTLKAGSVCEKLTENERARGHYSRALELARQTWGARSPPVGKALDVLGALSAREGRYDEAISALEEALEIMETHKESARALAALTNNLAGVYWEKRDFKEAKRLYSRSLEMDRQIYGEYHFNVGQAKFNIGLACEGLREFQEAERWYREAIEVLQSAVGFEHPEVAAGLEVLAGVCRRLERDEEAGQYLRRAIRIRENTQGPQHPELALALLQFGEYCEESRGMYDQAIEMYERAASILGSSLGEGHWYRAMAFSDLAEAHVDKGDFVQAKEFASEAIHLVQDASEPEIKVVFATALWRKGQALRGLGRPMEAERSFSDCLAIVERVGDRFDDDELLKFLDDYVSLLKKMGDVVKSSQLESRAERLRSRLNEHATPQ